MRSSIPGPMTSIRPMDTSHSATVAVASPSTTDGVSPSNRSKRPVGCQHRPTGLTERDGAARIEIPNKRLPRRCRVRATASSVNSQSSERISSERGEKWSITQVERNVDAGSHLNRGLNVRYDPCLFDRLSGRTYQPRDGWVLRGGQSSIELFGT